MNGVDITPRTLTGMRLQSAEAFKSLDPDLNQMLDLTDKRADSLQPRHPAFEHATEAPGRRRLRHKLPHLLLNLHARNAEILLLKYLPVMSQGPAILCSTLIVAAVPRYPTNTPPTPKNYVQHLKIVAVLWYVSCLKSFCCRGTKLNVWWCPNPDILCWSPAPSASVHP